MKGSTSYAARLVFNVRHQFFLSASAGYPKSWLNKVKYPDYMHVYVKKIVPILKEMNDYLPNHPIPEGFEPRWKRILNIVDMEAQDYTRIQS